MILSLLHRFICYQWCVTSKIKTYIHNCKFLSRWICGKVHAQIRVKLKYFNFKNLGVDHYCIIVCGNDYVLASCIVPVLFLFSDEVPHGWISITLCICEGMSIFFMFHAFILNSSIDKSLCIIYSILERYLVKQCNLNLFFNRILHFFQSTKELLYFPFVCKQTDLKCHCNMNIL